MCKLLSLCLRSFHSIWLPLSCSSTVCVEGTGCLTPCQFDFPVSSGAQLAGATPPPSCGSPSLYCRPGPAGGARPRSLISSAHAPSSRAWLCVGLTVCLLRTRGFFRVGDNRGPCRADGCLVSSGHREVPAWEEKRSGEK